MKSLASLALDKVDLTAFKQLNLASKLIYLADQPALKQAIFSNRESLKAHLACNSTILPFLLDLRLDIEDDQLETFVARYVEGVCYTRRAYVNGLERHLTKAVNPYACGAILIPSLLPAKGAIGVLNNWSVISGPKIEGALLKDEKLMVTIPAFRKPGVNEVMMTKSLYDYGIKTIRSQLIKFFEGAALATLVISNVNVVLLVKEHVGLLAFDNLLEEHLPTLLNLTIHNNFYDIELTKGGPNETSVLKLDIYVMGITIKKLAIGVFLKTVDDNRTSIGFDTEVILQLSSITGHLGHVGTDQPNVASGGIASAVVSNLEDLVVAVTQRVRAVLNPRAIAIAIVTRCELKDHDAPFTLGDLDVNFVGRVVDVEGERVVVLAAAREIGTERSDDRFTDVSTGPARSDGLVGIQHLPPIGCL